MMNRRYKHTAAVKLGKTKPQWDDDIREADRLLYVGATTELLRRLDEQFNDAGGNASDFTSVFRPVRVLTVAWYSSFTEARRAGRRAARSLRERFPNDHICQHG